MMRYRWGPVVTSREMSHGTSGNESFKKNYQDRPHQDKFSRPLHSFWRLLAVIMASNSKFLVQERIKNRTYSNFTTSLGAWLKNFIFFILKTMITCIKLLTWYSWKTEDLINYTSTTGLLTIPLEIRLQIFGCLLRADDERICPPRPPPLPIHTWEILRLYYCI